MILKQRPLGPQTEPRMRAHNIICIHTMVGYLFSTDEMFKRGGYTGTESHFGVGGIWGSDRLAGLEGVVYQWQDTDFQADANLEGAGDVISIETADNAPRLAKDILAWTPKQVSAIVELIAELCRTYEIPPVLIPDTKPGRRGLAYHAQGIPPNLVQGGRKWSDSAGKECPGARRIKQFKEVIIPAVKAKLEDDVALTGPDKEWLKEQGPIWTKAGIMDWSNDPTIRNQPVHPGEPEGKPWTFEGFAAAQDRKADAANEKVTELQGKVETLTAQVAEMKANNLTLTQMVQELLNRTPAS